MPGRIGPLLTTGVALSVAAVVVANPVIVPRADLQVPAVQLSGTGDALDMLNKDFLSAIGPAQAEPPSNPLAVLKDLISTLAADASYLGRNAIVAAFFAGATAVTNPELTAASHPYVPDIPAPAVSGGAVDWSAAGATLPAAGPVSTEQLMALAAVPADLIPAAAEMVMTLMDDVHGITDDAVTAAFAAGALLMTQGGRAIDTLRDLVDTDLRSVLSGAVTAVGAVTSGDPERALINAIRGVIEQPVHQPLPVPTPTAPSPAIVEQASAGPGAPTRPVADDAANPVAAERVQRRKAVVGTPVILPAPAAGVVDPDIAGPDAPKGAPRPVASMGSPVRVGPANGVVSDVRNQADRILRGAADAARHTADRAAKAVAGPTGD